MMLRKLPLFVAVLLLGLAPAGVAAQSQVTQTVRILVRTTIPEMAVVRRVTHGALQALPDGQREVAFAVTVAANCRWTLRVRRVRWWDRRPLDSIQVQREDGQWVPLLLDTSPVAVIRNHELCSGDTHDIRLRVRDAEAVRVFERVEFVVAPSSRD